MKNSYSIKYPANIVFGTGSIEQLPDFMPESPRIMIVTGKSAIKTGVAEKIISVLKDYKIIDATGMSMPEPNLKCIDALIEKGRIENATAVIGLGGGSTIDAAKAAAALIPKEGKTSDYFSGKYKITGKGLFFAALPTTSGTGAEITNNSVLIDSNLKIKKSLRHPSMIANVALIDSELTLSAPPSVTVYSGLDALTQAIESYVSKKANNYTKAVAQKAVKLLFNNIEQAYKNGSDIMVREKMAEGSMLSAMAFSQSGLGAVHAFAHPIGSLKHIPHGKICAILLPHVINYNLKNCSEAFTVLAKACNLNSVDKFLDSIRTLNKKFEIPQNLSGIKFSSDDIDFVVKNSKSNSFYCNPASFSDEEIRIFLTNLINKL